MTLSPIEEVILSDYAQASRDEIDDDDSLKSVSKALKLALTRLKLDGQHGDNLSITRVRSKRSYKPFRVRHEDPENLFCVNLPLAWRLIYYITRADNRIYVYVCEIVSHDQYSKWFPGKRYK